MMNITAEEKEIGNCENEACRRCERITQQVKEKQRCN